MATTFAVPDGRVAMAATLWPGTNATNSISNAVNTVSFQPDFVWLKDRTQAQYHTLYDSVRGSGSARSLILPLTDAEGGQSNLYGFLSSFNSNGFTLTPGSTSSAWVNASGDNYVGWQWKAGGTAVSNTAGTITSSVSANTTAGFSVVTYTGTGANATVGHALGVAPSLIIGKGRGTQVATSNWATYHVSLGNTQRVWLDLTNAAGTSATYYNSTSPTNTVFSLGTEGTINGNGATYVAYCWAPVAGYSAFGSYTGNGSADGPFIYTGFRPRWLMIKGSTYVSSWIIFDTSRSANNETKLILYPNDSAAETNNAYGVDVLSNGFKLRQPTGYGSNNSGETYIYAAFAESAFKFSNAR
jgi:hypothetical protein